jgi:phosphatidylglycerol lysyltransferase
MQSRIIRQVRRSQRTQATGKLRVVFALAVAVMGVINDLTVLLPTRPGRLALLGSLLNQLTPFSPSIWPVLDTGRTLALILGFFLLVVAFGLARGKRRAWQFALLLLPLSALAHLAKGLAVEEALLALLLWLGLLRSASLFRVASDPWRLLQGVVLLVLGALLLSIYTVSGLSLLQAQFLLPGTVGGFVRSFLLRLVYIPAGEIIPLSRHAAWFLGSLAWLGATVLLTGMVLLLRPVGARWWAAYQKEREARVRHQARELVRRYGNQTLSFFALAPENLRYLAPNGEGLVSYRLTGNIAVVLGDPICPPEATPRVTRAFLDLCASNDWQVAFYQAHPEHLPIYQALGLHVFKIGEEALLSLQTFTLSGSAMANVRTNCRHAEREGVTIQWYDGMPPKEVLEQLEPLSSAWLERKAGKHAAEMGFSLGRFDGLAEAAARADALAKTQLAGEDLPHDAVPRLVTGVASEQTERACALCHLYPDLWVGAYLGVGSRPDATGARCSSGSDGTVAGASSGAFP